MTHHRQIIAAVLIASVVSGAEQPNGPPAQLLAELEAECAQPKTPDKPVWTSYLSETERIRWRIMTALQEQKAIAIRAIQADYATAKGEYRDMLTVTLASLGESNAVAQATNLLLSAKSPAVRICAAKALRDAKDKTAIPALKVAMRDPYRREDGGCVKIGDGMCYPVRIVASCALADMGVDWRTFGRLKNEDLAQPPVRGDSGIHAEDGTVSGTPKP